jgi:hypothetical protein
VHTANIFAISALLGCSVACRDLSEYSSGQGHYEGVIAGGDFVRSGFDSGVRICLWLDAEKLQVAPGSLQTSDGRIAKATSMRTIPQSFHDTLSTLKFGEERDQNMIYMASTKSGPDAMVVLSLLKGGSVEARILRGAPGASSSDSSEPLFAIFSMTKEQGTCSF